MSADQHYLHGLFEPTAIAVVGASERRGSAGWQLWHRLADARYAGALHPVNPGHAQLFGRPCVPRIAALPAPVDLAILCLAARRLPAAIAASARAGIGNALIVGADPAAGIAPAQVAALIACARKHGVRLLGPDSLGFVRPGIALNASTCALPLRSGAIALLTQSASLFSATLDWGHSAGIGFSAAISLGSESDVELAEGLDYLACDPATQAIFLCLEQVGNARRFMSALRAAARCKPVLLLTVGRRDGLADDILDEAIHRAGAVRLSTLAQLFAAARALFSQVRPRGNRLTIIGNGGGAAALAVARAADLHIPLAPLLPESLARLAALRPALPAIGNPIDLGIDADAQRYREAIAICLADSGVDGVMVLHAPHGNSDALDIAQCVAQIARPGGKPLLACWMGGQGALDAADRLEDAGIPSFRTPEPAVEMFAQLSRYFHAQQLLLQTPASLATQAAPHVDAARLLIDCARDAGRAQLSSMEAKAVLAAFDIPIAPTAIARSAAEAVRLADEIGLPVVLKVVAPGLRRKSDFGGVRPGLRDQASVREAYAAILRSIRQRLPEQRIDGISVEPMIDKPNGRELMVGVVADPVFGPTLIFGRGGTDVDDEHGQRAVALPPLNAFLVAEMLRTAPVAHRLGEFRALPAVNREALQAVLLRVSEMVCELPSLHGLSINPLIVDEHGAVAVDVSMDLAGPAAPQDGRYAHMAIHPYPAHLEGHFTAADGRSALIRPIRPEDAAIEQAFVQALSPQSRYLRFMNAIRELSPAQLIRLTQIDYDREMAFIALCAETGPLHEVGVARYVMNPDGRTCEFAIVVGDGWQGKGLGRALMGRLIACARERGLQRMNGDFLADNTRMLRFVEGLGFVLGRHPDDAGLIRGEFDLHS